MIVFKLYFKLFFKNIGTIIMYSLIFMAVILLVMNSSSINMPEFEAEQTRVLFYDLDDTELTNGLKTYLSAYSEYVEIEDHFVEDAFFYRDIEYIMTIPKGFTESFLTNNQMEIERRLIPDDTSGYFLDGKINNYLNLAYAYLNNDVVELSELNARITADLANETEVVFPSEEVHDLRFINIYFNYLGYILIALIVTISGVVITSFTNFKVRRRNTIASISNNKFTWILILSTIITSLVFLLVFAIIAYFLFPNILFTKPGLIMLANTLVYTFAIVALAYLITVLFKNKALIGGIATVISLGLAFTSGAFIPQMLLGDGVLGFARLFPLYYQIKNNDLISSTNGVIPNEFYTNLIILVGFGIIYSVITVLVNKKKIQLES